MNFESEMQELAEGAIAAHGQLKEVIFLEGNTDSLLVFSDGTVLPISYRKHGYNIKNESYAFQVAAESGGTDPFSLLTFGYSGLGPTCYAAFLRAAGFRSTNVEDVVPPLKLRPDGSKVCGAVYEGAIQWENGSETP